MCGPRAIGEGESPLGCPPACAPATKTAARSAKSATSEKRLTDTIGPPSGLRSCGGAWTARRHTLIEGLAAEGVNDGGANPGRYPPERARDDPGCSSRTAQTIGPIGFLFFFHHRGRRDLPRP